MSNSAVPSPLMASKLDGVREASGTTIVVENDKFFASLQSPEHVTSPRLMVHREDS
jgi:hypothetical protein